MKNYLMLFAAAAVAAASMLTAATATADTPSRTVRIAAVNYEGGVAASVDLAVSAGDESISLYAVHGAADQGADMTAWDSVDSVATVPASESEQIVNYPVSRPHDAFYRFMLASVNAPFKKQLAFLKSTGSQHFILGDKCPDQNWRVAADVSFNYFVSGYNQGYWGARKAPRDSSFLCLCQGSATLRFDTAGGTPTYSATLDRRYQIDQSNQGASLVWDGGSDNVAVSTADFTSPCPMGLFAVNSNGSPTALARGKMTLYSFKVWTNRTDEASLIYDLVPCVKDDDTVTFYNRADGSFLSPAAGTFTYDEADVVEPTVGDQTVASVTESLTADKQILSSSIVSRNGALEARLALTTGFASNQVVVAYGAADGGANPAHWDRCSALGTVAHDETSFSAVLPFAWSKSVACARFFTIGNSDSLADKLLMSSGTQYIVTDYMATSNTMVEARAAFIDTTTHPIVLWSGRESSNPQLQSFGMVLDTGRLRVDYGGGTTMKTGQLIAGDTLHTVSMGGLQFRYDDATSSFDASSKPLTIAGAPLTFFAMNTAGTIAYTSRVAFAEVKVWSDYADETSLVLHLKPAIENGRCGFRNILEGGRFYPNSAGSGDDFEILYPNLNVHSVSEPISSSAGTGTAIYLI